MVTWRGSGEPSDSYDHNLRPTVTTVEGGPTEGDATIDGCTKEGQILECRKWKNVSNSGGVFLLQTAKSKQHLLTVSSSSASVHRPPLQLYLLSVFCSFFFVKFLLFIISLSCYCWFCRRYVNYLSRCRTSAVLAMPPCLLVIACFATSTMNNSLCFISSCGIGEGLIILIYDCPIADDINLSVFFLIQHKNKILNHLSLETGILQLNRYVRKRRLREGFDAS